MSKANEQIKKAKEILEEISENEHEQYLAHLREKYILDQNNLLDTGYERGFEQGSKKQLIEVAKEMKKQNYTYDEIEKITKLSKEEIEKL